MALASTEGGNKDTLVPEIIKYGCIYTKKPNRNAFLFTSKTRIQLNRMVFIFFTTVKLKITLPHCVKQ